MADPDFDRIFAEGGAKDTIVDADYDGGWDDIAGALPPTKAEFNALQNESDLKSKYLFDRLPDGYFKGFETVLAADALHDITIGEGKCNDSTDTVRIVSAANITKQIDAAWADGSDTGGMAESLTVSADTTYHLFVICKADGTINAGYDTSVTAANLMAGAAVISAGYIYYRYIWSILTDSSANIINYLQVFNHCSIDVPIRDLTIANPTTTAQDRALSVPSGGLRMMVDVVASVEDNSPTLTTYVAITSTNQTVTLPSAAYYNIEINANSRWQQSRQTILTDALGQIQTRQSASTTDHILRLFTFAYENINRGNI
jgi:hypothetical protein